MLEEFTRNARLLIIDDEPANVDLLEQYLERAGYQHIQSATDSREAMELYCAFMPDLVLLDLMMPYLDGFQILEQMRASIPHGADIPILVLTADISASSRQRALTAGAKDFLTKPFDATELFARIRNLLETRYLHTLLQQENESLEQKINERTADLRTALTGVAAAERSTREAHVDTIHRLVVAAEYKDMDTASHIQRVAHFCRILGQAMHLSPEEVNVLHPASVMHDVGKIGIPDAILLKPGKLNSEEWEAMKKHTIIGGRILRNSSSPLLQAGEVIALSHHEKWDGSGYPTGLAGEEIPLTGRICAVADVFDALTVRRPYKPPLPNETAFKIIREGTGQHFDPRIVVAFFDHLDEILVVQQKYSDGAFNGSDSSLPHPDPS